MPRNQNSAKVALKKTQFHLEVLEDRSLPGNTVLGISGLENPLSLIKSGIKQTTSASSAASSKSVAGTVSTSASSTVLASNAASRILGQVAGSTLRQSASSSSGSNLSASADTYQGQSGSTDVVAAGSNAALNLLDSVATGSGATGVSSAPAASVNTSSDTSKQLEGFLGKVSGKASGSSQTSNSILSSPNTPSTGDGDAGSYELRSVLASSNPKSLTPAMLAGAATLQQTVKGLSYTASPASGTPTQIMNIGGYLTAASTLQPQQIVTNFISQNKAFLGLQDSDISAISVNYQYKWNNTGPTMLYLIQKYNGISLYGNNSISTASVATNGRLVSLANNLTPNLATSIKATSPTLTALNAISRAAQDAGNFLGVTFNYGTLFQTSAAVGTEQAAAFSNSVLSNDPITIKLNYLAVQPGDVRLVWNFQLYIPNSTYKFDYNIDAKTGEVLTRDNWIAADSYRVFATPVRNPDNGGRTLVVNPADSVASPYGWHDTNGKVGAEYTITRGNNVLAREARNGDPGSGFVGGNYAVGVNGNNYDFGLNLKNDPVTYIPAAVTNLFYWNNRIHDDLYNLGFNEEAGNYQQNNYSRGGLQNDPVYAYAQAGANLGQSDNAFFVPSVDGVAGRMAMFVAYAPADGTRDLDFEDDTIGHEYFHGVSNRLVGGPNVIGLSGGFQSRGLGEGFSDVNALYITTKATDNKNTPRPFGGYTGGPGNANFQDTNEPFGFRNYPYSYDMNIDPYTFADVDYTQAAHYKAIGPSTGSFYQIADVWASTINDMYWNLVDKYGFSTDFGHGNGGNDISMKLVLAGLAMTASNPTILAARNAILSADIALTGGANQFQIWSAFARRGMGVGAKDGVAGNAVAPDGRTLPCVVGVVENFDIPAGLINTNPPPVTTPGGDGTSDSLYEPNETSNAAFNLGTLTGTNTLSNLQVKAPVAGKAQDRDWFKFVPTKAGSLTITAEVSAAAGDLDIRMYRASSSATNATLTEIGVGQGTKRAAGTSEKITVAVGAGITYYFNVQGFNSGSGNYNIIINAPS